MYAMKKFLIIPCIIFLMALCGLFFGCGEAPSYTVTIKNETTKVVSYFYNGASETIGASETKKYEISRYTPAPTKIFDADEIASLKVTQGNNKYAFVDAAEYDLQVVNSLPIAVTIKAGNYINDPSHELTITPGTSATAAIFTNQPKFTTTAHYPVIIDYTFSARKGSDPANYNGTVYVLIR